MPPLAMLLLQRAIEEVSAAHSAAIAAARLDPQHPSETLPGKSSTSAQPHRLFESDGLNCTNSVDNSTAMRCAGNRDRLDKLNASVSTYGSSRSRRPTDSGGRCLLGDREPHVVRHGCKGRLPTEIADCIACTIFLAKLSSECCDPLRASSATLAVDRTHDTLAKAHPD
jgi:hypothetical protein